MAVLDIVFEGGVTAKMLHSRHRTNEEQAKFYDHCLHIATSRGFLQEVWYEGFTPVPSRPLGLRSPSVARSLLGDRKDHFHKLWLSLFRSAVLFARNVDGSAGVAVSCCQAATMEIKDPQEKLLFGTTTTDVVCEPL